MSRRAAAPASLAIPVVVTLLGLALRTWRLDFQPLWWDEGYSVFFATQGVSQVLAGTAVDTHPPLYYLLLRGWAGLTGWSDFSIRFLSVSLGVATIPVTFAMGRRLFNRASGWLAAGILAIAPFHIHHSQEARMYTLVPFLAVLSTYVLARLLTSHVASRPLWSVYGLSVALALYGHYYAIFVPAFHGLLVLSRYRRRPALVRQWAAVQALAFGLYLPWIAYLGPRLLSSVGGKVAAEGDPVWAPLPFAARFTVTALVGYDAEARVAAVLLLGTLAVVGLLARGHRGPGSAAVALAWLVVAMAGGWALNLQFPFNGFPRLLSYSALPLYLLVGAGLAILARRSVWLMLAAGILVAVLLFPTWRRYYTVGRWPDDDFRPLVQHLRVQGRPDDIVICDFPWQAGYILSYFRTTPPELYVAPLGQWVAEDGQMERDLSALLGSHRRLWYLAYQGLGGTRGRNIEAFLTREAFPADDRWYGHTRLLLYGSASWTPLLEGNIGATFGEHVTLLSFATARDGVGPGDILPVSLRWQVESAMEQRYKVFAHLLDATPRVVAQRDAEPHAGAFPTTDWLPGQMITDNYGLLIPDDLPSGEYALELGLYDPVTDQRLPVMSDGRVVDDKVWPTATLRINR